LLYKIRYKFNFNFSLKGITVNEQCGRVFLTQQ